MAGALALVLAFSKQHICPPLWFLLFAFFCLFVFDEPSSLAFRELGAPSFAMIPWFALVFVCLAWPMGWEEGKVLSRFCVLVCVGAAVYRIVYASTTTLHGRDRWRLATIDWLLSGG